MEKFSFCECKIEKVFFFLPRIPLNFFALANLANLTNFQSMSHLQQIPYFRELVLTFTLFSDAGQYDGKKSKTRNNMKTKISFLIW